MKKLTLTTIIILGIGLAMVVVGAILQGISWGSGFNGDALASALNNIGYITAMLSGVVLTGTGIAYAIKNGSECKKTASATTIANVVVKTKKKKSK